MLPERQDDEFLALVKRAADCGFWLYAELRNIVEAIEAGKSYNLDNAKKLIEQVENKKADV